MKWLNFLTYIYGKEQNIPHFPIWVMTPPRRTTRWLANIILPRYLAKHKFEESPTQEGVIISFTSFPARIGEVWQVVKSLKNQSVLPEKIILWLSKEQFPSRESIPDTLWAEEDDLFEVRMVEGDIRSHKKYYYAMQEFQGKTIVTCDDDVYYSPDMLKHLLDTSRQFPGCIIANTARKITRTNDGSISYNLWEGVKESYAHEELIQIGIGGVLYPPHVLHDLTLRDDLFMYLTPMADDIWLNAMARLIGTPIVKSDMKFIPLPVKSDSPSLCSVNNGQNRNDTQIAALRKYLMDNSLPDVYAERYKVSWGGVIRPIVSFTSFPARIENVWQVVECMFRQTVQPAKILLWLSKEQFPTRECIPMSLRERENDIFEIRMVDGDIRSHKKYYYVAKEYPDSLVFLIDDDIYYRPDIIERSLKAREKHPDAVICNYGYHIQFNQDCSSLKPYNKWKSVDGYSDADDLFFGSGGGTLICPSELHPDLTDIEKARQLTPIADDIWLNAMARLAKMKICMVGKGTILPVHNIDNETLASHNRGQCENDQQLKALMKEYGNVFCNKS